MRMAPDEVAGLQTSLSNWGRWGSADQIGALNFITPQISAAAAAGVRSGRSVSCARPLATAPAIDNPNPAQHHMTGTATEGHGADFIAVAPHGYATSHIDALCHIFADGRIYNGYPVEAVTAHGATQLGIDHLRNGIVTRGVLLDIAALRGAPDGMAPGERITPAELEGAERAADVRVGRGDALLVRTGRWPWRDAHGPWLPHEAMAGLDASCLSWLHDREIALLGSDGVSDVVPSGVEGFRLPIHTVAIVAMGLHLLDNLDFEALAEACAEERRWEFMFVVAPLVIERGTASPVNPLGIF